MSHLFGVHFSVLFEDTGEMKDRNQLKNGKRDNLISKNQIGLKNL